MSETLNGPSTLEGTRSVSVCPEPCFKNDSETDFLHLAHQAVLGKSIQEFREAISTALPIPEIVGACCHPIRPDGTPVQQLCLPYLLMKWMNQDFSFTIGPVRESSTSYPSD